MQGGYEQFKPLFGFPIVEVDSLSGIEPPTFGPHVERLNAVIRQYGHPRMFHLRLAVSYARFYRKRPPRSMRGK